MITSIWRVEPDSDLLVMLRSKKATLDSIMKLDLTALQSVKCMVVSDSSASIISLEACDIKKSHTLRVLIKCSRGTIDNDI